MSVDIVVSILAEYAVDKVVDLPVIDALVESVGDVIVDVLVEYDVVESVEISAYDEMVGSVIEFVVDLFVLIIFEFIVVSELEAAVSAVVGAVKTTAVETVIGLVANVIVWIVVGAIGTTIDAVETVAIVACFVCWSAVSEAWAFKIHI